MSSFDSIQATKLIIKCAVVSLFSSVSESKNSKILYFLLYLYNFAQDCTQNNMHLLKNIILLWLLLPVCSPAAQESNPFLEMIGNKYCDYFDRYEAINDSLFNGDSHDRYHLVRLLKEAAAADPTGEWELNRRMADCHIRFYDSRDGGFIPKDEYTAEQFADDFLTIARDAQKKGFLYVRLQALFKAGDAYRIFLNEYERAFACYLEVAAELDSLSQREFPWKLYMYREIADFYLSFREYTDAARFYRKITDDPDVTCKNNHRLYPALSGLAQCYSLMGEYERSDSCYLRILELSAPIEGDRYVWEGIAGGNIGYNYYLRGDMDKALSWMEAALGKMKRPNDDPYTSSLAANIANIYLRRHDVRLGKKYLDIALDYHCRTRLPKKNSHLLGVITRYYTLQNDYQRASSYLDSTFKAKDEEQEAFSGLVLRRVEQQLRAVDRRLHERELDAEKLRSKFYRHTVMWVSGALAVILALLLLLGYYYRRIRQAYHELVIRSQQWAGVESDEAMNETPPVEETTIDDGDREIMDKIEKTVVHDGFYKRTDLSLDALVAEVGLNRSYLSGALNRCVGKNFSSYVNEYRVKEAIRLMSDPVNANYTIETIAFESGFNDRSNFSRTFKKMTGLSPADFRRNLSQK